MGSFEATDLICIHFPAQLQHQVSICFLQFSPGLLDTINLGEECLFIQCLSVGKVFHLSFFLLQGLVMAHQIGSVLVEESIHSLFLFGS